MVKKQQYEDAVLGAFRDGLKGDIDRVLLVVVLQGLIINLMTKAGTKAGTKQTNIHNPAQPRAHPRAQLSPAMISPEPSLSPALIPNPAYLPAQPSPIRSGPAQHVFLNTHRVLDDRASRHRGAVALSR
jgi:hypothetical protein